MIILFLLQLSTFEEHFAGRAKIDGVIYKVIPDTTAAAVNTGDVNIAVKVILYHPNYLLVTNLLLQGEIPC